MADKVTLYYFDGRGRMESVRWLLAAAGVEFDEVHIYKREQFLKLIKDDYLMFQELPLVEMDGMKLVQTRAILNYIAGKYNLYGENLKDRVMIDMYSEGTRDLTDTIKMMPFLKPEEKKAKLEFMKQRANTRYLPVYEKALAGAQYLVGGRLSCADVHLVEAVLMLEEKDPDAIAAYPNLQAFKKRMVSLPTIHKFLQPGSKKKPEPDDAYVRTVREVLNF